MGKQTQSTQQEKIVCKSGLTMHGVEADQDCPKWQQATFGLRLLTHPLG